MFIQFILHIISVIFIYNTHKKQIILHLLLINLSYLIYIINCAITQINIEGIISATYDAFILKDIFVKIMIFIFLIVCCFFITKKTK